MNTCALREKRRLINLTQLSVAQALGITVSAYTKKETGVNTFTLEQLQVIKSLFRLTDTEFIEIFFA